MNDIKLSKSQIVHNYLVFWVAECLFILVTIFWTAVRFSLGYTCSASYLCFYRRKKNEWKKNEWIKNECNNFISVTDIPAVFLVHWRKKVQGRRKWVGRAGNCPPKVWQISSTRGGRLCHMHYYLPTRGFPRPLT